MSQKTHILAIDQGTTSTRSIVFDRDAHAVALARREFQQYYPEPGWVEHDPEEIWKDVLATAREVIGKAGGADKIRRAGHHNAA